MGFSAGGGSVGTALAPKSKRRPIYRLALAIAKTSTLPAHAPPLFMAVGSSHFNVTNGCLALFAAWKSAGKRGIHVYDGVSAGFGMRKHGLLSTAGRSAVRRLLSAITSGVGQSK